MSIPGSPWGGVGADSALLRSWVSQGVLPRCCTHQCCCLVLSAAMGVSWHCCLPWPWCCLGCSWHALPDGWFSQKGEGRWEEICREPAEEGWCWGDQQDRAFPCCCLCYLHAKVWCNSRVLEWDWRASVLLLSYISDSLWPWAICTQLSLQVNQENNAYLSFYATLKWPTERWWVLLFIDSHNFPTSYINFCSLELNIYISWSGKINFPLRGDVSCLPNYCFNGDYSNMN